jgi:exodeoxyribonuclease VII large subunit
VVTVAELGRRLRGLLEGETLGLWVEGEISGFRVVPSGHAYFTLKDEREDAAIDCVMYRTAPVRARNLLADGERLVLGGKVTFWPPRGRTQLVVDRAKPAGRGALLEALARLKEKLAAEGLFDPAKKRPLPAEPRTIGVVTSAGGAAIHDIVKVAFRRGPVHIVLAPAQVQGQGAAAQIARALGELARFPGIDAVIVGRGGGSSDDLSAFNDEALVRAVRACPVPVVAAVGHEIDVSLVDLAADVRASTPSQAAELLVPDTRSRVAMLRQLERRLAMAVRRGLDERLERVDDLERDLATHGRRIIATRRDRLARLERRLSARHPAAVLRVARAAIAPLEQRLRVAIERKVARPRVRVPDLAARLERSMIALVNARRARLAEHAARLDALSPLAVLSRGYAIVSNAHGSVVRAAGELAAGDDVRVRLGRGTFEARVAAVDVPSDEPS